MNSAHYAYVFAIALSLAGASSPAAVVPSELATAAGSAGEPSPEFRDRREQGIEFHNGALEGDEEAAEKAVERLERYVETFSNDGEARAYLGSAYAMMARDASSVVNKMRYTNRGLRHLDRALEVAPRDFAVRLIRANVNSSLPKMFRRGEAALQDMLALDEIFREAPSPGLARWMVEIYETLQRHTPDAGPWDERLERARELSKELQER